MTARPAPGPPKLTQEELEEMEERMQEFALTMRADFLRVMGREMNWNESIQVVQALKRHMGICAGIHPFK